jgi:hypothetical protein
MTRPHRLRASKKAVWRFLYQWHSTFDTHAPEGREIVRQTVGCDILMLLSLCIVSIRLLSLNLHAGDRVEVGPRHADWRSDLANSRASSMFIPADILEYSQIEQARCYLVRNSEAHPCRGTRRNSSERPFLLDGSKSSRIVLHGHGEERPQASSSLVTMRSMWRV